MQHAAISSSAQTGEIERLKVALEEERQSRRSLENAYRRSAEESHVIHEAGNLLASTLELDRIYTIMRGLIEASMQCTGLLVSHYNPSSNLITCSYAWVEGNWIDPAGFPAIPLATEGRGRQSTVIRTGQPLLIHDSDSAEHASVTEYHVDSDGTCRPEPVREKPRTRSILMVPIRLEGQVLGIVQVQAHQPGAYNEDDLRLLEAMVLQMAAAERNAFLYRQVHEKLEERTRNEAELREKQAEIEALNERLRRSVVETHHRVKNNLQVIAAMIDMYLIDELESIPRSELERMGGHIITLGLVHDLLTADAKHEGFATTLSADQMLSALLKLMRRVARHIQIEESFEPAVIPVRQATSVALIVNELVSNAFKHGKSRVNVGLTWAGDELRIEVSDDGPGFPPGFAPALQGHTGLDLVEHICMLDLSGRTEYSNTPDGGAHVRVAFPALFQDLRPC